jgi:hypothetical protein
MTHHVGNLTVTDKNVEYAKTLTSVGGRLYIRAECELPALTSVGGGLYIRAECELPTLASVGGELDIRAECELPVLASVGGGLSIRAKCELPVLTSVGGKLYICAKCGLPALASVGGVPGKLIAVSRYGLWKSNEGLYYAGCRQNLTLDQAINHWSNRTDERALKFIGAILANLDN